MDTLILEYCRKPKTVEYDAKVQYATVDEMSREILCPMTLSEMTGVSLAKAIEALQFCMREKPHKRVFFIQTPYQEKSERPLKLWEIPEETRELILSDLPKAIEAFSPVFVRKGTIK